MLLVGMGTQINGSRNFCGVAEMVGPVDFEATTDFWQRRGKFLVKWHIIKDVTFTQVCILHWKTVETNQLYTVETLNN